VAAGTVSVIAMQAFTAKAEADRKTWNDELARESHRSALAPYAGKRGALRQVWADLSTDTKRTIMSEALGAVTIKASAHKGKRFDVTRIAFGPAPKVKTIG